MSGGGGSAPVNTTTVNPGSSSHTTSENSPRVYGLTVQTSSYGLTIPITYGRTRVPGNLLWIGNFWTETYTQYRITSSTPTTTTTTTTPGTNGGKFGKSTAATTTTTIQEGSTQSETVYYYKYFADWVFSVGEGPTTGWVASWREKYKFIPMYDRYAYRAGHIGQEPLWFEGAQTLGYSGLSLMYAAPGQLHANGGLPAFSFEINGLQQFGNGIADSNPADIMLDLTTNPRYGAGFVSSPFHDLTDYRNYCTALGLFVSPSYNTQRPLVEMIGELLEITNSTVVHSQGKLRVVPYCDAPVSGNGASYTPNTAPLYDLDDGDFLDESSGVGPVKVNRRTPADAKNSVRIEYLDRYQDYVTAIVDATDQAQIDANGPRALENKQYTCITNPATARMVAQLQLQRGLYVANEYEFSLGWNYALLEPMDFVTLTDPLLGLNKTPVRILSISENETGELRVIAEDYPFGVASAVVYPDQPSLASVTDFNVSPGFVLNPLFIEPPIEMAGPTMLSVWALATSASPTWGGCDVWYSFDGDEYRMAGSINGGSIFGATTTVVATDSTSLGVQLTGQGGQLLNVPAQDAENGGSLCWLAGTESTDGGEFFSYSGADVTAANAYTLSGLIRGQYQSNVFQKPIGTAFAKLDSAIVSTGPVQRSLIGQPVYFKFLSRNVYGGGQQSIEDVDPYIYTLRGNMAALPPPDIAGFGIDGAMLTWLPANATDLSGYTIRFHYGINANWDTAAPLFDGHITATQHNLVTRPSGVVTYLIKAVDIYGNASRKSASIITDLGDALVANVVQSFPSHPVFLGEKTSCTVVSGSLVANDLDAFFSADAQALFEQDAAPMFAASAYASMAYITEPVDVNAALAGSIATLAIQYQGSDIAIYYRKVSPGPLFEADADYFFPVDADPMFPGASQWQPWPGQIQIENDIYQFKVEIGGGATRGEIAQLELIVDAPDMVEYINNLPVDVSGTAIPYERPFTSIQNVQASLQAGTSGAVSVEITKTSPLAPSLKAFNASHTAVAGATVDLILKGY